MNESIKNQAINRVRKQKDKINSSGQWSQTTSSHILENLLLLLKQEKLQCTSSNQINPQKLLFLHYQTRTYIVPYEFFLPGFFSPSR